MTATGIGYRPPGEEKRQNAIYRTSCKKISSS